jgi:hypothetical protein
LLNDVIEPELLKVIKYKQSLFKLTEEEKLRFKSVNLEDEKAFKQQEITFNIGVSDISLRDKLILDSAPMELISQSN